MRILNVMQCTNLGGMERSAFELMRGLRRRGHECEVVSLNPLGGLGPLLAAEHIPARGFEYLGRGGWRSQLRVRAALGQHNADAVLMTGHHLLTSLALSRANRGRQLLAVHFHHSGVKPQWQWRVIYGVALRRFRRMIFPSEYLRSEASRICRAVHDRSVVIRNPVAWRDSTTRIDRQRARQRLNVPHDVKLVGSAGWLIPRKRCDVFLKVARLVYMVEPKSYFIVAGDGPDRERLEELADVLGISHRVKWLGWLRDTGSFYKSLDVFLFNSDWDAFPTAPLEAMSYGTPVVASLVNGGLHEVLQADAGYLMRSHNIDALAESVMRCFGAAGATLGEAGRRRVRDMCDPERALDGFERLLREYGSE